MHYTMLEKIGLSLIILAWIIFGSYFLTDQLITVDDSNVDALRLVAEETEEAASEEVVEVAAPVVEDIAMLIASASADAGQKLFKNCKACHTVDKGGKNKVGPNLWNIVGRDKASIEGFKYTDAMTSTGGTWGYEELNAFLTDTDNVVPFTRMKFKGMRKASDRAALLVFLNAQSD